jgi:hypothetical protein
VPQACFGSSTIEVPPRHLRVLETAIVNTLWGNHHALRSRELCFGALWDPLKVHPQWFSILYSFRDLRRILSKREELRLAFLALFKKRLETPFPLQGPGPTRALLMHLTKCGWGKVPTTSTLIVAQNELGTMDFFTAPLAQLTRWLSYTARQHIFEGLRARAEGETSGFPRKDAKGIPPLFVPDLEVNRLLLDGKVSEKLMEHSSFRGTARRNQLQKT